MSQALEKGQTLLLDENRYELSQVTIGLGWDMRAVRWKWVRDWFFQDSDFDLDAFALLLQSDGKLHADEDVISFYNLELSDETVRHTGDSLTGEGEGDDEQILLHLKALAEKYRQIILAVNIYEGATRKQHFGMIANAFVRVIDGREQEIVRFDLSASAQLAGTYCLLLGSLYREQNQWFFRALGETLTATDITEVAHLYM